jgi:hypothetical protein
MVAYRGLLIILVIGSVNAWRMALVVGAQLDMMEMSRGFLRDFLVYIGGAWSVDGDTVLCEEARRLFEWFVNIY